VKFGVNLINFGPGVDHQSLARWIKESEALGYHLVMTSDHIAITEDVQSRYPAPFYEPISTLGWMAGITKTIEIGTTVLIAPYRHILETAKSCATIDQLSEGRLICGFGVGWSSQEYASLGIPFESRGAITNEYLEALRILWSQEVATYHGRYVSFENVHTAPSPFRRFPPIWIGGASDAALRRTAKFGDAWHPIRIEMDWFKNTGIPKLNYFAQEEHMPVPRLCPRIKLDLSETDAPEKGRLVGHGSLKQIRQDLLELEELGCEYVVFDTYNEDYTASDHALHGLPLLSILSDNVIDLGSETVK
jgi:probable F420-dependent oxidoreductase